MKIALIVNTSKEKAISCAYNIATLLQKQGAELIALKEHQIFDADLESAQNYSSLFENRSKYNAIMSTLADILYREMRRAGGK